MRFEIWDLGFEIWDLGFGIWEIAVPPEGVLKFEILNLKSTKSACKKGRVGVEVASKVTGEEAGLKLAEEADRGFFVEEGVGDFVLLAFLPGGEDFFAGRVFEEDRAVFFEIEILEGDLLAVEEGEGGAVCKEGAEFFHQVEGEGGAAGAVAVEEAALGIEAAGFEGAAAVVREEGVEKGKQGVDGVERWAAGPT